MKFILLVLIGVKMSVAVANINYSEAELSNSQESLTNAIMTAIIEECDNLETREAYYNCVAASVSKIIKMGTLPSPPIPWEQNPPREPGPDDVPDNYGINMGHPLVMVMPEGPDDRRGEPGPDDRPIRKIPVTSEPQGDNEFWPLF